MTHNHQNAQAEQTAAVIKQQLPADFEAQLAIILGSGLGPLAEQIDAILTIPYGDLPGFHVSTVHGHQGRLVIGYWQGMSVVCLQGRAHFYEGVAVETMQLIIRTLKCLGCQQVIITNAAGSLRAEVGPGSLLVVNDHINFQGINPLVGPNDARFGPRFVPMEQAYHPALRQRFQQVAAQAAIPVSEGVYIGVLGPTFETPAEIRAFRILGADAVGMSTVPEVILANHAGMKVLCVSIITNLAAGMENCALSHEETLAQANASAGTLMTLMALYVASLAKDPV
jgi:xanthosine phosphorylase